MKLLIKTTKPEMCDKCRREQQQNSAKTPKKSPTHTRAVYKQLVDMCTCVCVFVCTCVD